MYLYLHDIVSVKESFTRLKTGHGQVFYAKEILVKDTEGVEYVIKLFSDKKSILK